MNLLAEIGATLFDVAATKEDYPFTDKKFPLIRKTTEHYRNGACTASYSTVTYKNNY